MSPEYAMDGAFSVKSDTYSFGVLLLEIISGLKISLPHLSDFPNLLAYVSTINSNFASTSNETSNFIGVWFNWFRHGTYGMMKSQWIWWTLPLLIIVHQLKFYGVFI